MLISCMFSYYTGVSVGTPAGCIVHNNCLYNSVQIFWNNPWKSEINGLVQDCSISIANALEIL